MKNAFVHIERINNQQYCFKSSNKAGIRQVARALTFQDPSPYAYTHLKKLYDKRFFTFQIGMLSNVVEHCQDNKIKYEIYDYEYEPFETTIDERLSGKWSHQGEAVRAFFEQRFGILVIPTRGGKTFVFSEIARHFLENEEGQILFVVDNQMLFSQAIGDFENFFKPYGGIEIGKIQGQTIELDKRITVAMVQTLQSIMGKSYRNKKTQRDVKKYLKGLKFLAIDEIHDNFSTSRQSIYNKATNIEYLLCLSATPYKAGAFSQNLKLQAWSGGIIYTIEEETLRQRNVLSDYRVMLVTIDHDLIMYDLDGSEQYADYKQKLIIDSFERNRAAFLLMELLQDLGLKTLNLFQSVEHGEQFDTKAGIPFICGETKAEDRESAKELFLNGKGGILSASNIFKKGITLPQVQVLLNVDGGLEDANTTQKKGRVLGWMEDKTRSAIIDILDLSSAYFTNHSEARLDTYVDAIGYSNIEVVDISDPEWIVKVKNWLIEWFADEINSLDTQ